MNILKIFNFGLKNDEIIKKNLSFLNNNLVLLQGESVGGNAGSGENGPRVALNFRYESKSGLIVYFGNFRQEHETKYKNRGKGSFIFEYHFEKNLLKAYPIVSVYFRDKWFIKRKQTPSSKAKKILRKTALLFNKSKGFQANIKYQD